MLTTLIRRMLSAPYKKQTREPGQGRSPSNILSNQNQIDIKNTFSIYKQDFNLIFKILHPQVSKIDAKTYTTNQANPLMMITFIQKGNGLPDEMNWDNRRVFALKWRDIGKMLYIEAGKGYQTSIKIERKESDLSWYTNEIQISDKKENKHIQLKLNHTSHKKEDSSIRVLEVKQPLTCKLTYQEYRMIYELLQSSIYELSGWKLQIQIQREMFISQMFYPVHNDENLDNYSDESESMNGKY